MTQRAVPAGLDLPELRPNSLPVAGDRVTVALSRM